MTAEFDETTLANQPNGLPRPVRVRVGLSWGVLAAERLWPALWPSSGIVGVFLILALGNVFSILPEWLHLTLLFGFLAAIVGAVVYSLKDAVFPTRAHAVRHLEVSSGLTHRPLTALEDHPAVGDNEDTGRLWRAHRLQIVRRISKLQVGWPQLSLAERDPYALRILLVLVLLAMLIANWSDVPRRLEAALSPGFAQGHAPATFEAWVTPPAYTGEAPRHLTATTRPAPGSPGDIIDVPAGSELTVRTHGEANPVLRLGSLGHSGLDPDRPDFVAAGGDARDAKVKIVKDMSVKLTLSTLLASQWRFRVVADQPPQISFKTPIAVTQSQSLRFNYTVKDDYGVVAAEAMIALDDRAKCGEPSKAIRVDLPLPPSPARNGEATIFKDLTAHVWAGLPVVVTLCARDEAHTKPTASAPMRITLPERRFTNALARALIEQRKALARDNLAPQVTKALDALLIAPERFMPDVRNYLALRTVAFIVPRTQTKLRDVRLRLSAEKDAATRKALETTDGQLSVDIASAQQLLWDLAMRLEEGDAPQAQADLRAAQQQLMDALARGASDQEIAKLLAQLRAAIERTMKAMADQAQNMGANVRDPNMRVIRPQDLQQMLDSIQNLARQGSRQAAQQLLSQMQNMLENMQAMGSGAMSPQQKAQSEALEKLGDMIGQQRGLMDKTFREQTAREDPERGGAANPQRYQQLSGEQAQLGEQLSQITKQLGQGQDVPDALQQAQRSMAQAAEDLAQGRLGQAGQSQQKAIDQMRRGGQAVAQQLMQQMARQGGMMNGEGPGAGENQDPFGRPQASYGPSYGDSVKVPDKLDIQKAREILEELQRRAAERGRPTYELDYLDRLLRRF